jgi:hypothetical protein
MAGTVRGDPLPALVTTSPPGTAQGAAGVGGQPTTAILFGAKDVNTQYRTGIRAELGYWFDPDQKFGVEAGFFVLGGASTVFAASSNGTPILAQPFVDVNPATTGPAANLVAFTGPAGSTVATAGSIYASDVAHHFYGFNLDLRENVVATPVFRLDTLLGYRFVDYAERLNVSTSTTFVTAPRIAAGTVLQASDSFATRNLFNGLDIGLRADWSYGPFTLGLLGKIAGGHLAHDIQISGIQQATVPGAPTVTRPAGFLAQASNEGSPGSHSWTFVPEGGVTLGWDVTGNIRLTAGYSALWVLNAARPGLEVDTTLNSSAFPGSPNPQAGPTAPIPFPKATSTLWVQSISAGVEIRY